jgi:hypothetical protein
VLPKFYAAVSFTMLLILISCDNPAELTSDTGTLEVRMIDSPGMFDEVNIQVDSVQTHITSSDSIHGWYTLNSTPATYDLLKLVNDADTVIGQADLPTGKYSQIRLYIGSGSNVVINSVQYPLEISSGSQSGLKLNIHATIEPNITYTLMLDFDAARSIVVTGNQSYQLKPVIRTVAAATTGNIVGTVLPPSAGPTIWAYSQSDTLTTTTDPTGAFRLAYLIPDSYSVHIVPSNTTYRDSTLTGVLVTAGNTTSIGTISLTPP